MMRNGNSSQSPQFVNLVRPVKTYRHSLSIKQWLLRKEQSFELQELEEVRWQSLMQEHLERCLLLVGKNQAEPKD